MYFMCISCMLCMGEKAPFLCYAKLCKNNNDNIHSHFHQLLYKYEIYLNHLRIFLEICRKYKYQL